VLRSLDDINDEEEEEKDTELVCGPWSILRVMQRPEFEAKRRQDACAVIEGWNDAVMHNDARMQELFELIIGVWQDSLEELMRQNEQEEEEQGQ
jgi:hypothetical protein